LIAFILIYCQRRRTHHSGFAAVQIQFLFLAANESSLTQ